LRSSLAPRWLLVLRGAADLVGNLRFRRLPPRNFAPHGAEHSPKWHRRVRDLVILTGDVP
jgi:hypothetical protein